MNEFEICANCGQRLGLHAIVGNRCPTPGNNGYLTTSFSPQPTMQNNLLFKTTSVAQRNALLAALLELGYKWHGKNKWTARMIEETYPFRIHPTICIARSDRSMAGNDQPSTCTIDELLFVLPETRNVTVGTYQASITSGTDNIIVGCQTVTIQQVRDVVAAWEELNRK